MREPVSSVAPADDERRAVRRQALSVAAATSAYGLSLGALGVSDGLTVWQTCLTSLLLFSGGSQFALIGVLASGGASAGFAAVVGAALLGTRNGLYAIRMSPIIGGPWWRRLIAAQFTIDESTAVATAQPTPSGQRAGFWWTAITLYLGWNLTTLIGALIGDALGDVRAYGLDAAAAAAFLGLLWPRLTALQPVVVAAGAAVVAALLTPALPAGVPILIAALVAVLVGFFNWFGKRVPA
jgi:predicted branched-subunit amino acid permease